jgi:DNA helicase IV
MIIVDEAQDMTRDILESLDVLTDHLTLCLDENQILDADVSSKIPYVDMDIIKDIYPDIRPIELTRNYRNTKEIYEFAATKFMSKNEVANNPILTRNVRSDKDSTPVFIDGKIDLMSQVDTICDILNKTPDSHTIGILVPDMNTRDSISIELEKR